MSHPSSQLRSAFGNSCYEKLNVVSNLWHLVTYAEVRNVRLGKAQGRIPRWKRIQTLQIFYMMPGRRVGFGLAPLGRSWLFQGLLARGNHLMFAVKIPGDGASKRSSARGPRRPRGLIHHHVTTREFAEPRTWVLFAAYRHEFFHIR